MALKNKAHSTPSFIFFAFAAVGKGISGGDRIFIEFARRWSKKYSIDIYLWREGYEMCKRQKLSSKNVAFHVSQMSPWYKLGFTINYVARIIRASWIACFLRISDPNNTYCYSASEFWMDVFPCFILKVRYPTITWIASWYQTAPNPVAGFSEGNRNNVYRGRALLYWLVQAPSKLLIKQSADYVLVNNEVEKKGFSKKRVIVVIGAVDLDLIDAYSKKHPSITKKYDAVFQGRFHPQKGVVELVEIWNKIVYIKKQAKLVMIGDGPLMDEVKKAITKYSLDENIILLGYIFDGDEKYRAFSESKLVVHPSFYDSGGMAAAEAMAFGLPAVGFSLQAYDSYYPKGMVKVEKGDKEKFADTILELLDNTKKRDTIGNEAKHMIRQQYSWEERSAEIFEKVTGIPYA